MANSKKVTVKAVTTFFDKKENKRRNVNETFEVTEKRLEEIKAFQENKKLVLIEVVENETPEGNDNPDGSDMPKETETPEDNETPKKGKGKKQ